MTIEVTGMLHTGYRIGTDGDQVDTIVEFYKKVFQLDIDPNRPHIPTIPGAWIQLLQARGSSYPNLKSSPRSIYSLPMAYHRLLEVNRKTRREHT